MRVRGERGDGIRGGGKDATEGTRIDQPVLSMPREMGSVGMASDDNGWEW